MTHAEGRIVEFLISSNPTAMADLPDWFLVLVEEEGGEEPSHELITAATFMLIRRERPGIEFDAVPRILAGYAGDPAKLEELSARIQAFRLACAFERLKRAGLYEDVMIGDPFDPAAEVSVRLTEETLRFFNANPTRQEVHAYMQARRGLN